MDITGTCCTCNSWTCQGCWGCQTVFWWLQMVLAVQPMVELVEVAKGVLEPSDNLGTPPNCFLFWKCSWNMFQIIIYGQEKPTSPAPGGWLWGHHRGTWSKKMEYKISYI